MDWSACARMVSLHTKSVPLNKIFMKVLIVIDAQNEFSAQGKRPVPGHSHILDQIRLRVEHARQENCAIALGKYGENASSALPALTNLLAHPRARIRTAASNAIVGISKPLEAVGASR